MAKLAEALGIETLEGSFTVLLRRGTSVPFLYPDIFSTSKKDQPAVTVRLVAGDPSAGGPTRRLGELVLKDLPPSPPGVLQIQLIVSVGGRGAVSVSLRHPLTGEVESAAMGTVALSDLT